MSKEDRRQYIFAQLRSLPNAIQYVEVTKYIEDLEHQVKKQKEVIDKITAIINYYGVDKEYNDNIILRHILKDMLDIIKEVSE